MAISSHLGRLLFKTGTVRKSFSSRLDQSRLTCSWELEERVSSPSLTWLQQFWCVYLLPQRSLLSMHLLLWISKALPLLPFFFSSLILVFAKNCDVSRAILLHLKDFLHTLCLFDNYYSHNFNE